MNYRPNQCPNCFYLTETRFAETNERGKDICGWDNKYFNGQSKKKCARYATNKGLAPNQ